MDVEGAPAWLNSARYSIDAKAETPQTGVMMRGPMLQMLLEERFHLAIHRASREEDAYIMTVAKGGLKAPRTSEGSCIPFDFSEALSMKPGDVDESKLCGVPRQSTHGSRAVVDVKGITFSNFARILRPNGRFVIDETGLEGLYDLHFEWEPNAPASDRTRPPIPRHTPLRWKRRKLSSASGLPPVRACVSTWSSITSRNP